MSIIVVVVLVVLVVLVSSIVNSSYMISVDVSDEHDAEADGAATTRKTRLRPNCHTRDPSSHSYDGNKRRTLRSELDVNKAIFTRALIHIIAQQTSPHHSQSTLLFGVPLALRSLLFDSHSNKIETSNRLLCALISK